MQSLNIEFGGIRRRNYDRLIQPHRKKKYPFAFLGNIKSDSLPFKVKLLDAHYLLMREIDDVVDGDIISDISPIEYVDGKIDFIQNYEQPSDLVEMLMRQFHQEVFENNPNAARNLRDSTQLLFEAWKFDANRISQMRYSGKPIIYSDSEITDYVTNMELYGIMKGALAILGEEPEKVELLKPLVLAARRYHYFLRDVAEDVAEGCFNISGEELGTDIQYIDDFVEQSRRHADLLDTSRKEFASLSYTRKKINNKSFEASQQAAIKNYFDNSPDSVKYWAKSQVEQGQKSLNQYRKSEASKEFGLLSRIFLFSCYERRAAKFFEQMSAH